jgi:pilus assembly protein CpaC
VKIRSRIPFALLCALAIAICAEAILPAQTPGPATPAGQSASRDAANELSVTVGKSALVDFTRPVIRVAVGLGDVAEATAVSPTEVMVNGRAPGNTSLIVWEQGGERQFFNVAVHPSRAASDDILTSLRRELKIALPGQNITVASENNLVFLRGTVNDLASSDRAVQMASSAGKVVNLLYVNVPPPPPQILLKVRFAAVDRNKSNQLGLNLFSTGATNTLGTVTTGQFSPPSVTVPSANSPAVATISNALNIFLFRPDLNLGATIAAMEQQGLAQILAEPNIIAEDGKQASFLAGGEYPYPTVQGTAGGVGGAITISFKEFGVRLNFIPTITPRGTIRLQVAPEVSALDFSNAVTISGFTEPAITVRRVRTVVELNEGQSFAIGGLLDNRETQTFTKIPFIGSVPILGKLFQSIQKNRTNTELIVIVTPEIVAPIDAGQPIPQLNYPEKFLPPNSNMPMTNPTAPTNSTAPTTPGPSATGVKPPLTIPVEQLIKSMQPEKPLVTEGSSGGYGSGSSGSTSMSSTPQ